MTDELAKLKSKSDEDYDAWQVTRDYIAALTRERDALRGDAARYRWLRDSCRDGDILAGLGWNGQEEGGVDGWIDRAITKIVADGETRTEIDGQKEYYDDAARSK